MTTHNPIMDDPFLIAPLPADRIALITRHVDGLRAPVGCDWSIRRPFAPVPTVVSKLSDAVGRAVIVKQIDVPETAPIWRELVANATALSDLRGSVSQGRLARLLAVDSDTRSLIFEHVCGPTCLAAMADPIGYPDTVGLMADWLAAFHAGATDDGTDHRDTLIGWAQDRRDQIRDERLAIVQPDRFLACLTRFQSALRGVRALRCPTALNHGDVHFGNIIRSPDGMVGLDAEQPRYLPTGYDLSDLMARYVFRFGTPDGRPVAAFRDCAPLAEIVSRYRAGSDAFIDDHAVEIFFIQALLKAWLWWYPTGVPEEPDAAARMVCLQETVEARVDRLSSVRMQTAQGLLLRLLKRG